MILISAIFAAPFGSVALAQGERALSVEQAGVADVKPPEQAFTITASLSNANGEYRIGDHVGLSVEVDKPAYLLVVNVDEAGSVTQLFPNEYHSNNYVAGGQAIAMPGEGARIVVAGPAGIELIKIIASENPLTLDDITITAPVGPFVTSPPGSASHMSRALGVVPAEKTPTPEPETSQPEEPVADIGLGAWGDFNLLLTALPADGAALPAQSAPGGSATESPDAPPASEDVADGGTTQPEDAADADAKPSQPDVPPSGDDTAEKTPPADQPADGDEVADATPAVDAPIPDPKPTAFELELSADRASYRPGDAIRFTAAATEVCALTLLGIGAGGETVQLLPNARQTDTVLSAGEAKEFGGFRADTPTGTQTVKALCTTPADSLDDAQPASRDISLAPEPAPAARIAEATLTIEIAD
ncbi:MAG: DUF4384 domain-containing protein [Pseudomonadota bacterium]